MTTPAAPPLDLLRPQVAAAAPQGKTREAIEKTARDFEASFISQMLGTMFEGIEPEGPFGGGSGEAAFKSFLMDAVAQQMSRAGGLGLADDLTREMLKMQGLE